jgi:hypothetical protein
MIHEDLFDITVYHLLLYCHIINSVSSYPYYYYYYIIIILLLYYYINIMY